MILAPVLASFYIWFVSDHNKYGVEKFLGHAANGDPYVNLYNVCLLGVLVVGVLLLPIQGLRPALGTLLWVVALVLGLRVADGVLSGVVPLTGVLDSPGLGAWLAAVPWRSLEVIAIALWIGFVAWRVSWRYPQVGTKPLVHTGGLIILMVVVTQFMVPSAPSEKDREMMPRASRRTTGSASPGPSRKTSTRPSDESAGSSRSGTPSETARAPGRVPRPRTCPRGAPRRAPPAASHAATHRPRSSGW